MVPLINEIYQHRYGGIYVVANIATHTTTKEQLVIYMHVYPFDESTFARPIEEWTDDRFRQISHDEFDKLMCRDRTEFQIEITTAKAVNK